MQPYQNGREHRYAYLQEMADLPLHIVETGDEHETDYNRVLLALNRARLRIEKIKKTRPEGYDVIRELDTCEEELDSELKRLYSKLLRKSTPEMYALTRRVYAALRTHHYDTYQDRDLYRIVSCAYRKRETLGLTSAQTRLLESYRGSFLGYGITLDKRGRNRLRHIAQELDDLSNTFEENIKNYRQHAVIFVKHASSLKGLPREALAAARHEAAKRGRPNAYALTPEADGTSPYLAYLENRALRKKFWFMRAGTGHVQHADNAPVAYQIAKLRHEQARLLGYKTFAHMCMPDRMPARPADVTAFLDRLLVAAKPAAERDLAELSAFAAKTGAIKKLEPWDIAYYSEKLRHEKFGLNQKQLREYFPLESVLDGFFKHAQKLFGITFKPAQADPENPELRNFTVHDSRTRRPLGELRFDFYANPGKEDGAWMHALENHRVLRSGEKTLPVAVISCNFAKAGRGRTTLLSMEDVKTIFHEGGHALHEIFSDMETATLSGTNVNHDFVELPSIFQENWATSPATLRMFARHYKTGAPLPRTTIDTINEAENFMAGYNLLDYLHMCYIDVAWHLHFTPKAKDIAAFEAGILEGKTIMPSHGTVVSPRFGHIFSGGYEFGYYGYEWARRMADYAFGIFRKNGGYNKSLGLKFREKVLSQNSIDSMSQFRSFAKRDPHPDTTLRTRHIAPPAP